MKTLLRWLFAVIASALLFNQTIAEETSSQLKRPNVVFILTDNHGEWTLGCYGNQDIKTPHLDQMAKEGTLFENAFANNAVCSPTRATLLTGLMPCQHGVHCYLRGGNVQIGPEAYNTLQEFETLPSLLSDAGYVCGLSGKWHLGDNLNPQEGFSFWTTKPHGSSLGFYDQEVIEKEKIRTESEYLTKYWTDRGLEFIESNCDKPFFLMLAYNGPYGLGGAMKEPIKNGFQETYAKSLLKSFPDGEPHPWNHNYGEWVGQRSIMEKYAAEVSGIDQGVGRVLDTLERLGLTENTLVVFVADQGLSGGHSGFWGMGDHTRPLTAFDWTMQVPLIYRWPAQIVANQRVEKVVDHTDFLPTMTELLNLRKNDNTPFPSPGKSYAAMLRGETMTKWDETMYYEFENVRAIRTPQWKYIERIYQAPNELYDLTSDPEELHNLIDAPQQQARVAQLKKQLHEHFKQIANPKWDIWNGGDSKSQLMMATLFEEGRTAAESGKAEEVETTKLALKVPEGYTVELAAGPELVRHPLMASFDDRGRLYVAASAGENLPRDVLEERLPNFVKRLEDTDGDGVFDESTMFADKLTFPQGSLWHEGSLYVASSGAIWKFTDRNDDGIAEERVKLLGDFGYTGNAADIHGPFLGPEGRIYWCDGRHGHEFRDEHGEIFSKGKAARIFSCRTDGSDIQTYCTGGMDNPVEIVFTPTGEMLGTVNLMYSRPRGDCLTHWLYGGVYPRTDFAEGLSSEFVLTGELLPEVHNFGHVAVSGLCRMEDNRFGPAAEGDLFVTQFNTNRIVRMSLQSSGSTFAVKSLEDFAVSENPDFHPTDVLQAPDGSLLIIDTGGWFRIGCPQSQVAKSHIPGSIYRVRWTGGQTTTHPGSKISERSKAQIEQVWSIRQAEHEEMIPQLGMLMKSSNAQVRQAVTRSLLDIDPEKAKPLQPALIQQLQEGSLAERRVAAEVLARWTITPSDLTVVFLQTLEALDNDRPIEHALILGLINAADRDALTPALLHSNPKVSQAAAVALEQLRRPQVNPEDQNWPDIPAASAGQPLSDEEQAYLLKTEQELPPGNTIRGQSLFAKSAAACSQCHRIAGKGGQIGPDLSTIGRSRSQRDLLEAILYPSASFVRGFASYTVLTEEGKTVSGIILSESPQQLRLGTSHEKPTTIATDQIEEIVASDISIMPSDVHKKLSRQDLADLIAYLKSLNGSQMTARN